MIEHEPISDLSKWTDTMIEAKLKQLMDDAYTENQKHKERLTAINTEIAELQKEKIKRSRKP